MKAICTPIPTEWMKDGQRNSLLERMLKEFERIFTEEYYKRAEELGMTIDENYYSGISD